MLTTGSPRHPICQSIADHRLYAWHERIKKYMKLFRDFYSITAKFFAKGVKGFHRGDFMVLWPKNATSYTTECFKLKELRVKKKYCFNPRQIGDNRRILYKESITDRIILHYHRPFPRQSDPRSGTTLLNSSQGLSTQRKLYLSEVFSQGRSFRWLQPNCYNNNNHTIFRYFNMLFLFIVEVINY